MKKNYQIDFKPSKLVTVITFVSVFMLVVYFSFSFTSKGTYSQYVCPDGMNPVADNLCCPGGTAYYDVSTHRCYTISQTVVSGYSSFEGGKCIYNHVYGFHVGDTENRDEFEDAKEVCEAVENSGVFSSFHCTITEPTIYMTQYTWRVEGTGYTDNCYVDAREKDYVPDPIEHVTVTINTRCSGETYGGAAYSITLEKGESLGNRYPGQPCEKEGSVFQGWIDEDGNPVSHYTVFNSDATIFAKWVEETNTPSEPLTPDTPEQVEVKFVSDSGLTYKTVTVDVGTHFSDLTVPKVTNVGKTLMGWYLDGNILFYDNGNIVDGKDGVINSDTTIEAKWRSDSNDIEIILYASGGVFSDGSSAATRTVTIGSSYGALPIPTRNGYTFDGWYTYSGERISDSDGVGTVPVSSVRAFTAHWIDNATCTVTLESCDLKIGYAGEIKANVALSNHSGEKTYTYQFTNTEHNGASIDASSNVSGSLNTRLYPTFSEFLRVTGNSSGYVESSVVVTLSNGVSCTSNIVHVGLEECAGSNCGSATVPEEREPVPDEPTPGGDTPSDPTPGGDTPSDSTPDEPTPGGDTPSKITAGCYKCGDKYKYFAAGGTLDSNCGNSPVDGYTKNANDEFCTADTVPTTPKTKAGCYKCGSVYKYFSAGSTLDSNCGKSPVDGYTKNADNEFCTRPASYSSPATEVPENPQTGTVAIAIAWFAGITALVCSFYYFKKTYFM